MADWKMFNPNPSGRFVGDCAIRAVAKALDTDWDTAYALISQEGFVIKDVQPANSVWGSVLRKNGFYRHAIPNTCPMCYTIGQFADDHPEGLFVVGTGNHVVTIENGVVWDSWDSRNEIPQYYWSKED